MRWTGGADILDPVRAVHRVGGVIATSVAVVIAVVLTVEPSVMVVLSHGRLPGWVAARFVVRLVLVDGARGGARWFVRGV